MKDRYGYIGIETLLNYCQNSKDHSITPNDFMRMNRVRIEEPKKGKWTNKYKLTLGTCSICGEEGFEGNYCMWCGARMRGIDIMKKKVTRSE